MYFTFIHISFLMIIWEEKNTAGTFLHCQWEAIHLIMCLSTTWLMYLYDLELDLTRLSRDLWLLRTCSLTWSVTTSSTSCIPKTQPRCVFKTLLKEGYPCSIVASWLDCSFERIIYKSWFRCIPSNVKRGLYKCSNNIYRDTLVYCEPQIGTLNSTKKIWQYTRELQFTA